MDPVGLVKRLVEISSPSEDVSANWDVINEANDIINELLGSPGVISEVKGRPTLQWRGGPNPKVLLLCHLDTVWPHGSYLPMWSQEGDVLRGPGVFDMKAGFIQAVIATSQLSNKDGVVILATTDEEIGSECSRELLESVALECQAVFVFESAIDGKLKTGRKGTSMYQIEVIGRASHAGLDPEKGINATLEIATVYPNIISLNKPEIGTTVTPTTLKSGTVLNTVPERAVLDIDVRALTREEQERVHNGMMALNGISPGGATIRVQGDINRPALNPEMSATLFALAQISALELGLPPLEEAHVGGASDGNFTAAIGVPTIDGIGAVGAGAHAAHEWASASAISERANLVTRMLEKLLA